MVRIILLWNVCEQHDPYYIIVERKYVDNMVPIILLSNVYGQHGPYYIIEELM